MIKKVKIDSNFSYTIFAKITDLGLKFGILMLFLKFRNDEDLVQYTYFLSLGTILGTIFDWGGSRQNIRNYIVNSMLPLNLLSILIGGLVFSIIIFTNIVTFYNIFFLILCILYSLTIGWINTLYKFFEYINENRKIYKIQVITNVFGLLSISILIIFNIRLEYIYIVLFLMNLFLLLFLIIKNNNIIKWVFEIKLLKIGTPFLINSLAAMIFSQINVVILNQFGTIGQISNYTLAQRLIDVSLILTNSYNSSKIGQFFKKELNISILKRNTFLIWLFTFIFCIPISFLISSFNQDYRITPFLFLALMPLGLVRAISPTYSIVMDYTKHYMLRTYIIIFILFLNISFSHMVIKLPGSVYMFCFYNDVLILLLLLFYIVSFKKYKIYETFYN